jgi:methionyl-tRNA formyltransferase
MRALLIGAVEGTRVALDAIAAAPDWALAAVATLPPERAARHSDYVDLTEPAEQAGARLIHVVDGNGEAFVEQVRAVAPDMVFVIGWSQLCGPALRAAVGDRIVGYHTAALPRLRGRATIPWTILLDEKISGSTLFRIDDGVDSGAILAQRFFHIAPDETAETLYAKHMKALRVMLDELLPRLAQGEVPGEVQDERLATWATRRRADDGRIDWRLPADDIHRLVRAVGRPYPGAFTLTRDTRITIWRTEHCHDGPRHHALPGQVVARDEAGFAVCCGDGRALRIVESDAIRPPAMHSHLGTNQ